LFDEVSGAVCPLHLSTQRHAVDLGTPGPRPERECARFGR
jgi:hypothetical protein